ncbi:MAG: DUF2085 domain-containing protein [Bacteroidota bacterium]
MDPFGRKAYIAVLIAAAVWFGLIVMAPYLASLGGLGETLSSVLYSFYGRICHQLDSRSFHLFGHKLAVCSRCTMIYGGFLAGLLIFPFLGYERTRRFPRWGLFLALSLLGFDAIAGMTPIWTSTITTRSLSGLIAGVALSLYLMPMLRDAAAQLIVQQKEV